MVWDAFIAIYLFLAGLGAGAFVLGALTNWAKKPAARMKRIAFIIAPVAVAVGTLVLVIDAKAGFANPLRFFMLVSNLNSVMAWGVIILSVFLAVSIADLVLLLVKKRTPKALDIAGMVLAVCVAAYTGVLLATRLAAPEEAGALPLLSKAGLVLPVLELVLVAVLLGVTAGTSGSGAAAGAASVASLVSGAYAVPFWLGFVGVGLVLPFALELAARRGARAPKAAAAAGDAAPGACPDGSAAAAAGSGRALALVGEAGVLVGGFMLRYLVIMAALAVAFA